MKIGPNLIAENPRPIVWNLCDLPSIVRLIVIMTHFIRKDYFFKTKVGTSSSNSGVHRGGRGRREEASDIAAGVVSAVAAAEASGVIAVRLST